MRDQPPITIIDYGAGNLRSVVNAIRSLGCEPVITSDPEVVLGALAVVLPGVGAAGDTMVNLKRLGLADAIRQVTAADRPFLGICIGLQVLFASTEEGGWHECLGLFSGRVRRLPNGLKVPHMGWNQVKQKMSHPIFDGIPDGVNFYFVHSYYVDPEDRGLIAGETEYGIPMCSAVARGNLAAVQFHPEKSGEVGLRVLKNFMNMASNVNKQA